MYKHKVRGLNGIVDKFRGAICNSAKENNNYMKKKEKEKKKKEVVYVILANLAHRQISLTSNLLSSHKDSK